MSLSPHGGQGNQKDLEYHQKAAWLNLLSNSSLYSPDDAYLIVLQALQDPDPNTATQAMKYISYCPEDKRLELFQLIYRHPSADVRSALLSGDIGLKEAVSKKLKENGFAKLPDEFFCENDWLLSVNPNGTIKGLRTRLDFNGVPTGIDIDTKNKAMLLHYNNQADADGQPKLGSQQLPSHKICFQMDDDGSFVEKYIYHTPKYNFTSVDLDGSPIQRIDFSTNNENYQNGMIVVDGKCYVPARFDIQDHVQDAILTDCKLNQEHGVNRFTLLYFQNPRIGFGIKPRGVMEETKTASRQFDDDEIKELSRGSQLLDIDRDYVQQNGYNGLSFDQIQTALRKDNVPLKKLPSGETYVDFGMKYNNTDPQDPKLTRDAEIAQEKQALLAQGDDLVQVIAKDREYITSQGLEHKQIAEPLYYFLRFGLSRLGNVAWYHGKQYRVSVEALNPGIQQTPEKSPLDSVTVPQKMVEIKNIETSESITLTYFQIYMIIKYGFYGGENSSLMRKSPEQFIKLLGLRDNKMSTQGDLNGILTRKQ